MKVVLTVAEDFAAPTFLLEGATSPGTLSGNNVVGRFVACAAFIEAAARHGTFEYAVCPFNFPDDVSPAREADWQGLARHLPLPLVRPTSLPTLLGQEKVLLHELARHRLNRLSYLRHFCASRPAPITAQLHGMGSGAFVEELCLTLLCPLLPDDTIFSSSQAADTALRAALATAADVLTHGGGKVTRPNVEQVPLGVDTDYFRPRSKGDARARLGIDPEEFVFLALGRLSPSDKIDFLPVLRGFRRVVNEVEHAKRVRLIIAGSDRNDRSGQYVSLLQRSVRDLGLQGHVSVLANFAADDRLPLFAAADVFLALSDAPGESFGLTVAEALCCGLPVVASDWDGYRDHIRHGVNGFKIPVYWSDQLEHLQALQFLTTQLQSDLATTQSVAVDIECLIETMLRCVLSPVSMLNAMSHEALRARETYSWRAMIRRHEETWERLADGREHASVSRVLPVTNRCHIFRSYPSNTLNPDSLLELTDGGSEKALSGEVVDGHQELAGTGFSSELIERILCVLASTGRPMAVSELEAGCGSIGRSQVLWHLLWLIKQGYIRMHRPVEGCTPPASPPTRLSATR